MKIIIITLMAMSFLNSCNVKPTKEQINENYIEKAKNYMSYMIKTDTTFQSFKIIKVDTVIPVTLQMLEASKMRALRDELDREMSLLEKYLDIENNFQTGSYMPITLNQKSRVDKLNDSLDAWSSRAAKLDNKKIIRKQVCFLADFVLANGTTMKKQSICYIFDLEGDLVAEDNPKR